MGTQTPLDYTDKNDEESSSTNSPSNHQEVKPTVPPTGKSLRLKIGDWLKENLILAIIIPLLLGLIGWATYDLIELDKAQAVLNSKSAQIEIDIQELKSINNENITKYYSLKEDYDIFKTEIKSDIDYLKKKVDDKFK